MWFNVVLTAVIALVALASAMPHLASPTTARKACNGHSELCQRRYSNVSFVGSHNSAFVGEYAADNQNVSVEAQLALGVRFLQGQTHDDPPIGGPRLCHTTCGMRDAGTLTEALLEPIKAFLDANPDEVITLLLTNQDGLTGKVFDYAFQTVGLNRYAFAAPSTGLKPEEWPTLGEMIGTGKRLVVFMDDIKSPTVPYILSEFDRYMVETPYEYDSYDDLSHCSIDRPHNASVGGRMLLINHMLQWNLSSLIYTPRRCMAPRTNALETIQRHAESCRTTLQKGPNFVLLDWVHVGDAMLMQDSLNGVGPTITTRAALDKRMPVRCDDPPHANSDGNSASSKRLLK